MGKVVSYIWNRFRQGDMILLLLCLITTAFGCLVLSSTTAYMGQIRLIIIQIAAAFLGILAFAIFSSIDAEFFSEHRGMLVGFNILLLAMLIPFGTDNGSGNRSWLAIPGLPFDIQPAEICKITYILISASVMAAHQNRPSHISSVVHLGFHLVLLVGMNMVLSSDAGVSLIFVFIFIGMAFAGGVSLFWFLMGGGALAVAAPIIWSMMDDYQRNRIEVLFNPDLDPLGRTVRYHTVNSLKSLTGGGLAGQGLYQGHRTQQGALFAQHTDFVFSSIGEELGFIGCIATVILILLIIIRCVWVGNRSSDYMRKMICYGAASALMFQMIVNIGMCIGIMPVIGLTLPFMSYGGSSLVTLYAMVGLVSGVYARPDAPSHERYIRPPNYSRFEL